MCDNIENTNIIDIKTISSPHQLKNKIPITSEICNLVTHTRDTIHNILIRKTKKLIVIIGPCSIHDKELALDYSERLSKIKKNYPNLLIIMRVYFEKPRTITGWKGLIMDPNLDDTCDIEKGLHLSREIMLKINQMGIPIGCEFLDTISAQYISDLVSWGAIGARTTESQLHRQLASGLSVPIGFKNTTEGNIDVAINSVLACKESHTFLGIDNNGIASIVKTKGNSNCHLILRGGKIPNYDTLTINNSIHMCKSKNIIPNIIIDCSHGNSQKKFYNQKIVINSICDQLKLNQENIIGAMIESNIYEGNQILLDKNKLKYGISITDECVSWTESIELLDKLNNSIII
jgi:3-deoxy-7-phosphoheptulonate synthase